MSTDLLCVHNSEFIYHYSIWKRTQDLRTISSRRALILIAQNVCTKRMMPLTFTTSGYCGQRVSGTRSDQLTQICIQGV